MFHLISRWMQHSRGIFKCRRCVLNLIGHKQDFFPMERKYRLCVLTELCFDLPFVEAGIHWLTAVRTLLHQTVPKSWCFFNVNSPSTIWCLMWALVFAFQIFACADYWDHLWRLPLYRVQSLCAASALCGTSVASHRRLPCKDRCFMCMLVNCPHHVTVIYLYSTSFKSGWESLSEHRN